MRLPKRTGIIVILLGIFLLTLGCKKYPDDPRRYWFKSPIKRLSSPSSWNLRVYYIDGADSIVTLCHRYVQSMPSLYNAGNIPFGVTGCSNSSINISTSIGSGNMELVDNKSKLHVKFITTNNCYNPFINNEGDWVIKELSEDILKLVATLNGQSYELVFQK